MNNLENIHRLSNGSTNRSVKMINSFASVKNFELIHLANQGSTRGQYKP